MLSGQGRESRGLPLQRLCEVRPPVEAGFVTKHGDEPRLQRSVCYQPVCTLLTSRQRISAYNSVPTLRIILISKCLSNGGVPTRTVERASERCKAMLIRLVLLAQAQLPRDSVPSPVRAASAPYAKPVPGAAPYIKPVPGALPNAKMRPLAVPYSSSECCWELRGIPKTVCKV